MTTDSGFVLAADIGGTNARFALFALGDGMRMAARTQLPTASFTSFRGLVEAAARELADTSGWTGASDSEHFPDTVAAALAVAGPVERGVFCRPPNIDYVMDLQALPAGMLPRASLLLNDFAAQAHGCRLFGEERSLPVLPGRMDPARTQAVVGPGTGLGKAALVPVPCARSGEDGGYVVCGSEGGHAAFPFNGPEERRFQEFVQAEVDEPFARWETVVSGSGLALLHRFHTGRSVATPAEAAAALEPGSPVAEWFARFLGRACRDYVLDVLATGGLFISGGVAARNPMLLEHGAFAREFRNSPAHADLLSAVSVRLVADQLVGLWGAASRALALAGARPGA